ncbi:MAG: hypothetical protein ACJ74Y_17645 [Bryobacteraceae bacterium]
MKDGADNTVDAGDVNQDDDYGCQQGDKYSQEYLVDGHPPEV